MAFTFHHRIQRLRRGALEPLSGQAVPSPGENFLEGFALATQWRIGAGRAEGNVPEISATDWGAREPELIRQLAQGNEAAFGTIYQRYQGPIFRFCWHMGSDPAMAEDVTQEAFLHLIRNPRMFDPTKGSLGGYLFGIARNMVRRNLARTRRQESLPDEECDSEYGRPAGDSDLLSALSQGELLDFLKTSLRALPEPYREVVVLCDMEEMSYPDAAVALGCSPGTIASRLHRGRSMLRSRLSRRFRNARNPGKQGCAR